MRSASELEKTQYTYDPSTAHGAARRDQIIHVATELFHDRGFHATGIDDIGAAAGITGPGIYRHFAGKNEILMAVLDRMWVMLRTGIEEADDLADRAGLDRLVERHVGLAVYRRAEFTLLVQDLRFLPGAYRGLARQNRATYRDAWASRISRLHSACSLEQARLVTGSAWRLSAGADDAMASSGLRDNQIEDVLVAMTNAAIERGAGSDCVDPDRI